MGAEGTRSGLFPAAWCRVRVLDAAEEDSLGRGLERRRALVFRV